MSRQLPKNTIAINPLHVRSVHIHHGGACEIEPVVYWSGDDIAKRQGRPHTFSPNTDHHEMWLECMRLAEKFKKN